MSRPSNTYQVLQSSEEDEETVIVTKFGEEPKPDLSWTRRLERGLYSVFARIIERQMISTPFACILIVFSFVQTYGLLFRSGGNHKIDDRFFDDLVQLFSIFGLTESILTKDNSVIYYVTAYVLFGIQILYFVGLCVVHRLSDNKKQCCLVLMLESFMTPIMYWILLIPTSQFFSSIFVCATVESQHEVLTKMTCWGTEHSLHVGAFSLGYVFCLLNTSMISMLGNDCNPYNVSNAFRRFPWNFELLYAIFRVVFSLLVYHVSNSTLVLIYQLSMLICSILFAVLYLRNCTYYNITLRRLLSLCFINLSWICLNCLLFQIAYLSKMSYCGRTAITVLGMTCSYTISDKLQEYYCDITLMTHDLVHVDHDETIEICLSRIISLSMLYDESCLSEEETRFLLGYLSMHRKECDLDDCPMKDVDDYYFPLTSEVSKKQERKFDDSIRLKFLIDRLYHNKMARRASQYTSLDALESTTRLFLPCAYYQMIIIGNHCVAGFILEEALSHDPPFWIKGAIFRANKFLERLQNHPKTEVLDVRLVLEYEGYVGMMKRRVNRTVGLVKKFCAELLMPRPNLNVVFDLGTKFIEGCESVTAIWELLRAMECDDPKTYALYSIYLASIRGREDEANEQLKRAKEIEASANDSLTTKASMFTESAALIVMGSDKENIGKIIKTNNGITSKFEYAPADLVGKDVAMLMPSFLGKNHTTYVSDYIKSGQSSIINKPYETYGVTKNGFIFGLSIYIREYYSIDHHTVFLGLVSPRLREEPTILTDIEGKLLGISYEAYAMISEFSPVLLTEQNVYMFYICPELHNELKQSDYSEYEGTVALTFSIPNNVQAVSSAVSTKLALYDTNELDCKKLTAHEVFRSEFVSVLDYIGCRRLMKWCTIANKQAGKARFKAITFALSDELWEETSTVKHGKEAGKNMESDLFVPCSDHSGLKRVIANRPQQIVRSRAKHLKDAVKENVYANSEMTSERSLALEKNAKLLVSSRTLDTIDIIVDADAPVENEHLGLLGKRKGSNNDKDGGSNEDSVSSKQKKVPFSRSLTERIVAVNESRNDGKSPSKPDHSTPAMITILANINSIKNSSFSKYTPKWITYAQRVAILFILLLMTMEALTFAYYNAAFGQMTYVLKMAGWTRGKEAVCIFEDIRSLSLMAPASDGKPLLNSSVRSLSYNYSTVYYANGLATGSTDIAMNYTQWKLLELRSLGDRLNEFDNEILFVFIKTNDGKEVIISNNITWVFNTNNGVYNPKQVNAYSLLTIIVNEAMRVYSKAQESIALVPEEFQQLYYNWYLNVMAALDKSAGVSLEPIRPAIDRSNRVALITLIITCSAIALCIIGTVFLLHHVTAEISDMLCFFNSITSKSLRNQMEKCTELANLLNFETNIDDNNRGPENVPNETEPDQLDAEGHNDEASDQEELRTSNNDEDKAKIKKKHSKKMFTEYSGGFWRRSVEAFLVSTVLSAYFIYGYLGAPRFYDTIECHLNELASLIKLIIKNEGLYLLAMESIGSNGTTKYNGIPVVYMISNSKTNMFSFIGSVSAYHEQHRSRYTSEYNDVFDRVFDNMPCVSEAVTNVTECTTIYDGGLARGLRLANIIYIETLYQTVLGFIYTPTAKRTLNVLRSILNNGTMQTMEIINKKYFFPLYMSMKGGIEKSMHEKVDAESWLSGLIFALYFLALVIVYLVYYRLYINSIKRDLFASKLLFTYLPLEMLTDNHKAIKHVLLFAQKLAADMKQ